MVMGLMADPGGHPPAAAVVWMLAALIVMYVSPFGILLGFLGLIRAPRKYALIGLLGNIGLGTLALYMMTPWKVL